MSDLGVIDRANIFINSKDRSETDDTFYNFNVKLNSNIDCLNCQADEELYMYPSRISLINDFYNIGTQNNTFTLGFTGIDLTTITIPEGYYGAYNFIDALTTAMNNGISIIFATTGFDPNTITFSMTYNPDNNEYSLVIESTDTLDLTTNTPYMVFGDNSPANMMGLNNSSTTNYIATSPAFCGVNSTKPVNFIYQPEINLKCNILRGNYENTNTAVEPTQTLMLINQNAPKNGTIVFENPNKLYRTLVASNFGSIGFQFVDNDGRDVLFQSNTLICLTFEKIKKQGKENEELATLKKIQQTQELGLLQKYMEQQRKTDYEKIKLADYKKTRKPDIKYY